MRKNYMMKMNIDCFPKAIPTIKNKEQTMYNRTPDQEKTEELNCWLESAMYQSEDQLKKDFFINNDDHPKDGEELVKRITEGRYELREISDFCGGGKTKQIIWRDPAHPADKAGFDAAMEEMRKAYTDTFRLIQIKSPDEGLEALKAFENTTFH